MDSLEIIQTFYTFIIKRYAFRKLLELSQNYQKQNGFENKANSENSKEESFLNKLMKKLFPPKTDEEKYKNDIQAAFGREEFLIDE